MAIVEKDNITLLKTVLDENMKIQVSIISADEGYLKAKYHFILVVLNDQLMIKCVCCTSVRDDPLHLYGTVRTIDEFFLFITSSNINVNGITYKIRKIKVYPFDWYECFESLKEDKIKDTEQILSVLKERMSGEVYTINSSMGPESKRDEDRRTIQAFFMQSSYT